VVSRNGLQVVDCGAGRRSKMEAGHV
jgi:hypothetical protein